MPFRDHPAARDLPPETEVVVWDLDIPAAAVGVVIAVCDGYENKIQLRAVEEGGPGSFMAWVPPAFKREIADLLSDLGRRFGVAAKGPRPFGPRDLGRGIPVRVTNI